MTPDQLRTSARVLVEHAGRLRHAAELALGVQHAPGGPAVVGGGLQTTVDATLDGLVEHGSTVEALLHQMAWELRVRAAEEERRLRELAAAGTA